MDELTDLLAADLDGSFERLVREHQDRLFGIALRLTGDARDAEEVAQDAFVRAYRALATYDGTRIRELNLRGWLATIAINLSRNRRRVRRPTSVSLDGAIDDGLQVRDAAADDPPTRIELRERADHWGRLVAALPDRYREVVVLRHVEGLGYAEIGAALGRPEGTLKAQAHRGLALLRAAHEAAEGGPVERTHGAARDAAVAIAAPPDTRHGLLEEISR